MYTRCSRNTKESYNFSSRNFWKEPNLLTMQIHKIYFMSTRLVGMQGSAMQEVVLILTGKGPVFIVGLLTAGRQICPQTCPPCPPAGRREVWEATRLNRWRGRENAYLLFWQQTRMHHLCHPGSFSLSLSISAARKRCRRYLRTSAQ